MTKNNTIKNKQKKTRQEINEESRLLKRKRKHKGLPSGSRFSDATKERNGNKNSAADPRIGSKKAVPLVISDVPVAAKTKQPTKSKVKEALLPPELELAQLENDPVLEQLLDMIESNKKLTPPQQKELDTMLNRIEVLMNELGYDYDDSDDDEDTDHDKEDIVGLLKKR